MIENLLKLFVRRDPIMQLASVSRQIAADSHDDVWLRIDPQIFDMELSEARGYVKARARAVVRRYCGRALSSRRDLPVRTHKIVAAMAIERVVHDVISELIAGVPARRRAA